MGFNRAQWIGTGLLTTGCLALFFGLRAVPVEPCDFLHYGDFVTEEGVLEGCGYEEAGFFDLEKLRFPIIAEIKPLGPVTVGVPATFQLTVQTSSGRPLDYADLAVSHTERLHAMVVDPSLEDYQHIHPRDAGAPGTYTFTLTPHRAGEYAVFLDFIPLQTARRTLLQARFEVAGAPTTVAHAGTRTRHRTADGYEIALLPEDGTAFVAGREIPFKLEVSPPEEGGELLFAPVMDAYAHIVAFEPARRGFAHFHPRNPFIAEQDPRAPELDFIFSVEDPGFYRVWVQFAVNGAERFIPFEIEVSAAS